MTRRLCGSGRPRDIFERIFSPYGKHDFEERLAIAEVDGNQNPLQAHRIAYSLTGKPLV